MRRTIIWVLVTAVVAALASWGAVVALRPRPTGPDGPAEAAASAPLPPPDGIKVALGERAGEVAVVAEGTRVLVGNSDGITVVDAYTGATIGTIGAGNGVSQLVVSPDETTVYTQGSGGIAVIDLRTNLVARTISLPAEYRTLQDLVGVTRDGTGLVAVASATPLRLIRIGVADAAVTELGDIANPSASVVLSTATDTVVLGSEDSFSPNPSPVRAVDLATKAVTPVPGTDGMARLAITADGRTVHAMSYTDRAVIDVAGKTVTTRGKPPADSSGEVLMARDGRHLFGQTPVSGGVVVYDTDDDSLVTRLPSGPFQTGMAVAPDGRRLYVSSRTGLSILDVSSWA